MLDDVGIAGRIHAVCKLCLWPGRSLSTATQQQQVVTLTNDQQNKHDEGWPLYVVSYEA